MESTLTLWGCDLNAIVKGLTVNAMVVWAITMGCDITAPLTKAGLAKRPAREVCEQVLKAAIAHKLKPFRAQAVQTDTAFVDEPRRGLNAPTVVHRSFSFHCDRSPAIQAIRMQARLIVCARTALARACVCADLPAC